MVTERNLGPYIVCSFNILDNRNVKESTSRLKLRKAAKFYHKLWYVVYK